MKNKAQNLERYILTLMNKISNYSSNCGVPKYQLELELEDCQIEYKLLIKQL